MQSTLVMPKNLIFKRIVARWIDITLAALAVALIHKVTGKEGFELVGALVLYQTLVILLKGNSLGKELLSLYVQPKGRYSRVRMFVREVLLWLLLPFILLALPFGATPIHDRLTNLTVTEYG